MIPAMPISTQSKDGMVPAGGPTQQHSEYKTQVWTWKDIIIFYQRLFRRDNSEAVSILGAGSGIPNPKKEKIADFPKPRKLSKGYRTSLGWSNIARLGLVWMPRGAAGCLHKYFKDLLLMSKVVPKWLAKKTERPFPSYSSSYSFKMPFTSARLAIFKFVYERLVKAGRRLTKVYWCRLSSASGLGKRYVNYSNEYLSGLHAQLSYLLLLSY